MADRQIEWEEHENRYRLNNQFVGSSWLIEIKLNWAPHVDVDTVPEWGKNHHVTTHEALSLKAVDRVPDDQLRPGMLAEAMRLLEIITNVAENVTDTLECKGLEFEKSERQIIANVQSFLSGQPIPEDPKLTGALELLRRLEDLDKGNDEAGEYLYMFETLCVDNAAFLSNHDTENPKSQVTNHQSLDTENPNSQVTNHQCKEEADQ